jgi:hypothetical protein
MLGLILIRLFGSVDLRISDVFQDGCGCGRGKDFYGGDDSYGDGSRCVPPFVICGVCGCSGVEACGGGGGGVLVSTLYIYCIKN